MHAAGPRCPRGRGRTSSAPTSPRRAAPRGRGGPRPRRPHRTSPATAPRTASPEPPSAHRRGPAKTRGAAAYEEAARIRGSDRRRDERRPRAATGPMQTSRSPYPRRVHRRGRRARPTLPDLGVGRSWRAHSRRSGAAPREDAQLVPTVAGGHDDQAADLEPDRPKEHAIHIQDSGGGPDGRSATTRILHARPSPAGPAPTSPEHPALRPAPLAEPPKAGRAGPTPGGDGRPRVGTPGPPSAAGGPPRTPGSRERPEPQRRSPEGASPADGRRFGEGPGRSRSLALAGARRSRAARSTGAGQSASGPRRRARERGAVPHCGRPGPGLRRQAA